MYVIGLDVGTSGIKSTVFDDQANVLNHAYREYNLICEQDGWFELDAELLFAKALEVLAESTKSCNRKQVRAICVTSFGESFVCMDEQDNVLAHTMIYMDRRGTEECAEFLEQHTEKDVFMNSGGFNDPMFSMYKMRWMHKHRPQVMEKVKRISFVADFITYRLGAEHQCDYSLAARSQMFQVRTKKWWEDAVAFSQIQTSALPEPVPGGSVVGDMSRRIARTLGMGEGVKLIVGGHDQILAACGSGAKKGDMANGMGTVDALTPIMDATQLDVDKMVEYRLPLIPYLTEETYVTSAFSMSGGCTIKWFRDTLAKDIAHLPNAYMRLNAEIPPDPTGLLMIPYFGGGCTPGMDGVTPAVLAGLRLHTTRGELFRAFLENETYEIKRAMNCLTDVGIPIHRMIAVGGGATSAAWMQIRADIFEREICTTKNKEAGTLASAILCYVNLGLFANLEEAQDRFTKIEHVYTPQQAMSVRYQDNFQRYLRLYEAVKEVYR